MDTRSPFEIRVDLIKIAKEYLDTVDKANTELARAWIHAINSGNVEIMKNIQAQIPTQAQIMDLLKPSYSIEDLLAQAAKLQEFVSKRG